MLAISQFPIKVAESMAKMILKEAQWLWMAWIYSWKSLTKETQEEEAEDIDYNLELIQEEDTNPYLDTSLDHEEDDQELMNLKLNQVLILGPQGHAISPQIDCVYTFDAEEHEFLGDLEKPANYKAALLDPESKKWLDAMNWLFKKKTDMDGAVYVFKARLVAKGFTQTYGVDYEETFSPVADIRAIRILIAIAAYYDYEIWQMDVKTALLLWTTFEEVYMEQPEGFMNPKYPNHIIYGNSRTGTIPMQEKLKLSKSQGASTPAEKQRMQNVPYASAIGSINVASAVGSIMYAVRCTRPDVAFAQNITSRFQQNPGDDHWTAVKNILKYLRNTKDMFLVYGGDMKRELRVSCYTDAGYLTDADDMKSQTGYVFILNGGVVDWKSTKQSIFATSSTDAEYIAAFDASKEAVWIRKFISGLGVVPTIEEPINMYCDNTGAIAIAKDHGVTKGARHFRAKVHYLRETIEMGDVKI
ncbi:putative retrotransposon protein [Tanacetum coccineum]